MAFFAPMIKFIVTRPVILPVATVGAGLSYGSFDISKGTTRALLGRKASQGTLLSYSCSVVVFGGTVFLRNLTSPHDFTVIELVKQNKMKELMANSRSLILRTGSTFAMAGVLSGAAYAYFSE